MNFNIMDESTYPKNEHIFSAFLVTQQKLEQYSYGDIMVSVSGGADSDIMIDIVEKIKPKNIKIHYVFFDTGLEYEATKRHLDYLENRYGINIERVRSKVPVPTAVKNYGQPWRNKYVSDRIERAQRHNFDFKIEDIPLEQLCEKWPKMKSFLTWWTNSAGENSQFNAGKDKKLREFLSEYPPQFPISQKCCKYTKKDPANDYKKNNNIVLALTGIRKSEGGIRATAYKNCFSAPDNKNTVAEYRPIFWMTNEDKRIYEEFYNIKHSDCYEIYGLKRTGCAGCPFAKDYNIELEIIKKYEPKLYNACLNIFGDSYKYHDAYIKFRGEKNESN